MPLALLAAFQSIATATCPPRQACHRVQQARPGGGGGGARVRARGRAGHCHVPVLAEAQLMVGGQGGAQGAGGQGGRGAGRSPGEAGPWGVHGVGHGPMYGQALGCLRR